MSPPGQLCPLLIGRSHGGQFPWENGAAGYECGELQCRLWDETVSECTFKSRTDLTRQFVGLMQEFVESQA